MSDKGFEILDRVKTQLRHTGKADIANAIVRAETFIGVEQKLRMAEIERRINAIPVYSVAANPEEGNLSIDPIDFSPIGFVGGWCRTEDVTAVLQGDKEE